MKIRITEVRPTADAPLVSFQSLAGSGTALWVGITPKIGDELDVEFELDEVFFWGKNITASSSHSPQLTDVNGVTQITAELIQVADENVAALQFGNSILLIELDGPIAQGSGYVDLITNRVLLYPTNT